MAEIIAPKVSRMSEIDDKSVVGLEKDGTTLVFKNRAGDDAGSLVPRRYNTPFVRAIARVGSFDSDYRDVLVKRFLDSYRDNSKLSDPASLPPDSARTIATSPDGKYVVCGLDSAPYIIIYKRSGDTLTKLADPASVPASVPTEISWSPDGRYLTLAITSSPYVWTYSRSGDVFTKLANPASLPSQSPSSVSWSRDSTYLILGHQVSPWVSMYKLSSGPVFTKLSLSITPGWGAPVNCVRWCPTDDLLVVGMTQGAYDSDSALELYRRVGDSLAKVYEVPGVVSPVAISTHQVSWAPDGLSLAQAWSASGSGINVFRRVNDTLVYSSGDTSHGAQAQSINYSPDGVYLAVGFAAFLAPVVIDDYGEGASRSLSGLTEPAWVSWSPDGRYLHLSTSGASPRVHHYKTANGGLPGALTRIVDA